MFYYGEYDGKKKQLDGTQNNNYFEFIEDYNKNKNFFSNTYKFKKFDAGLLVDDYLLVYKTIS